MQQMKKIYATNKIKCNYQTMFGFMTKCADLPSAWSIKESVGYGHQRFDFFGSKMYFCRLFFFLLIAAKLSEIDDRRIKRNIPTLPYSFRMLSVRINYEWLELLEKVIVSALRTLP